MGRALGTVIINLQQTERDGESTLRIFEETDTVFKALADHLNLEVTEEVLFSVSPPCSAIVPYNRQGKRSDRIRMELQLEEGAEVRLSPDHNCQGSRQNKLLHVYGNSGKKCIISQKK